MGWAALAIALVASVGVLTGLPAGALAVAPILAAAEGTHSPHARPRARPGRAIPAAIAMAAGFATLLTAIAAARAMIADGRGGMDVAIVPGGIFGTAPGVMLATYFLVRWVRRDHHVNPLPAFVSAALVAGTSATTCWSGVQAYVSSSTELPTSNVILWGTPVIFTAVFSAVFAWARD